MKIAIASDHGGFVLKEHLKKFLEKLGYSVIDHGTDSTASVDYPDYAIKVARDVSNEKVPVGVIIDGAGIGSTMVANKIPAVRAAMCNDIYSANNAREHNDANVVVLGSQVIGNGLAERIVEVFLKTAFAGGRHERRVKKINQLDAAKKGISNFDKSENQIEDIVSRIVQAFLNGNNILKANKPYSPANNPTAEIKASSSHVFKQLLTEEDVKTAISEGKTELLISKNTIITPLANDLIRDNKIILKH